LSRTIVAEEMPPHQAHRRSHLLLAATAAVLAAAGCASAPSGPALEAPQFVVGDHWQYRVTDNLRRGITSQLDAEVVAVTGHETSIHFEYVDANGRREWVDEVDGSGGLRSGVLYRLPPRQFDPPLQLLAFPMQRGKIWRQALDTFRKDLQIGDQILIYGQVGDSGSSTVPAGVYDTVYIYRLVQLDDSEFWRSRTTRRDFVWYAAALKAPAREQHDAEYVETGSGPDLAVVRTESTVLDLVSFRPGAP
jgi:hypothetical protein